MAPDPAEEAAEIAWVALRPHVEWPDGFALSFVFAVGSRVSARSWGACAYEVSVGGALRAAAPLLLINGGAESAAADGARERTAS